MEDIKNVTNLDTIRLTYIHFQLAFLGKLYEQSSSVVMRSPLSPIVENPFMEHFEQKFRDSYPLNPSFGIYTLTIKM